MQKQEPDREFRAMFTESESLHTLFIYMLNQVKYIENFSFRVKHSSLIYRSFYTPLKIRLAVYQ